MVIVKCSADKRNRPIDTDVWPPSRTSSRLYRWVQLAIAEFSLLSSSSLSNLLNVVNLKRNQSKQGLLVDQS